MHATTSRGAHDVSREGNRARRDRGVNPWILAFEGFDPDAEGERETLCTLGNGYFDSRVGAEGLEPPTSSL